jgi:multidrug resistance efflux pump
MANLAAAVASNHKAQGDVTRYGELLEQSVIARETYDEIDRVGKVDAAQSNRTAPQSVPRSARSGKPKRRSRPPGPRWTPPSST